MSNEVKRYTADVATCGMQDKCAALEAELATVRGVNQQLLGALESLYKATTQAPFNHEECEQARAAIAAARKGEGE